ncbi:MAG: protoporphyrinogen oxidase [bacterium]
MSKKITILGTGISGLATAYWLFKDGYDVEILEQKSVPGGSMETFSEEGFLLDLGPNSGLETTPLISKLAGEVGIRYQMLYASDVSNKRYILRNGTLHALPTTPLAFFITKLFSASAKFRLMKEPFIGKSEDGYYQSIADFVRRRLGNEFYDYAIDPFVSGVFAGDPEKLSVKSAFPKLYRLEEIYGGLIKGMIKGARERKKRAEQSKQSAKMFSFIGGMQSFPQAIANKLSGKIIYNASVENVLKKPNGYHVFYKKNGELKVTITDAVLSTLPAYTTAKILSAFGNELPVHLNSIYYPPVKVLYLGYEKSKIGRPLDGFGFLIPSKERKKFLGAIWSSTIFPRRAPNHFAAFTLFIGGARSPQIFEGDQKILIREVLSEFAGIMRITANPIFMKERMWENAIPQYNLGYIEHENYFDKFEQENPGIFLSGNYRGGISVGDCVKNSELVFNKIKTAIEHR